MKNSIDISSALFKLVNTPELKAVINGKVYIGTPPVGDQAENVSVNVLTNGIEYLQQGIANVNIHLLALQNGRPNLSKFEELLAVIIPAIEDTQMDGVYFQLDDDKGLVEKGDSDNVYMYNLRLVFQTFKK